MTRQAVENVEPWKKSGKKEKCRYYSVEIPVEGLNIVYQFRIWTSNSASTSILVRADSAILPWLKLEKRVNMKYYPIDRVAPGKYLDTEIHHITRQEQGPFKGHYLVGFEVQEKPIHDDMHGFYKAGGGKVLPFYPSLGDAVRE